MKKNIILNNEIVVVDVLRISENQVTFIYKEKEYSISLKSKDGNSLVLNNGKANSQVFFDGKSCVVNGFDYNLEYPTKSRNSGKAQDGGGSISPMPGKILKVLVEAGSEVKKGETLLVMEAMKMEHAIKAQEDSLVKELLYSAGDLVDGGVELISLTPIEG